MILMLTWAGAISLLIWIYLLLFHGRFWRVSSMVAAPVQTASNTARVAAIIPARDEAEVIGRSITSLLQQTGPGSLHIVVIDDNSTDSTASAAAQAAHQAGRECGLTVIQGQPLAPGWSGKLWAVQQGIDRAREFGPDFFLLTDADIEHSPQSVATLTEIALTGRYDLVSLMVRLHCDTFAERALIPAFVFFFLKLYPPVWIRNPRYKMAGAAGGSILIRPDALSHAGGIEAIRNEVIDDCALARRVKQSGGRVWLGMAEETRSIRAYGGFAGIGRMISRGAFNQLGHSPWMLLLAVAGLTVTYLVPPLLLLFSRRWLPGSLGAAAWLLMVICFLPMVRFYRLNPLWVLALPLTAVFYMGASLHSAFMFWMGRGGEWKGRIQDPAPSR